MSSECRQRGGRNSEAVVAMRTVSQNSSNCGRRTDQTQITVLLNLVVNPEGPNKKVKATVLFVSGCQRPFVTDELAEQL
ncbi:unnamed protein product [Gongylonema pulchrum]|uniref:Kinesin motor domain-containing protein n=1 Tax=Gongylonema pulchrum TaxID=637853 RepID=A0A183CWQ0_9BILA|nr:unnamed protein product [Gongylonema pulchrum]